MKNRLFKKVFAAVLTVAMIMTTNGVTAFAVKNVKVENVYTNVKKLSMATGTTKQITTYTEPENATNQSVLFSSSNRKVATVTPDGIVKAIAPGKTTITVTSKDNVEAIEKVAVTVLNNLVINKSKLDSDGEVLVLDKTYGNVIVDSSIGDAPVYLSGVKITNKLSLEQGKYKVFMYDSSAKAVEVVENADEITSFADVESTASEPIPGLYVLSHSQVTAITSELSFFLGQDGTSRINSFIINQPNPIIITIDMNGFSGDLFVNSSARGGVLLNAQGCNIPRATVSGTANSGSVQFVNNENSTIGSLLLGGSAYVDLQVPADLVSIGRNSSGAALTVGAPVQALNNEGSGSNIILGAEVGSLTSTGPNSNIQMNEGAAVEEEELAKDTVVKDTTTTGGGFGGGGGAGGGGAGGGGTESVINTLVGSTIVNEDFDDASLHPRLAKNGGSLTTYSNPGYESKSCFLVSRRTESYDGVAVSLLPYTAMNAGKHIKIKVSAKVKYVDGPDTLTFKATVDDGSYSTAATVVANKGEWTTIEGEDYIIKGSAPKLYIELVEDGSDHHNYYVDNFNVTIKEVTPLVQVDSVTLNKESEVLGVKAKTQLTATVLPENAEDRSVTWTTNSTKVATVDLNGKVTAVGAGTAIITAKANFGGKTASCVITVDPTVIFYEMSVKDCVVLSSLGETQSLEADLLMNTSPIDADITYSVEDTGVVTVDNDGNATAVSRGTTYVTASTVREGKTYSATCKVIVETETIVYKNTYDSSSDDIGLTSRGTGSTPNYDENGYVKVTGRTANWNGASYIYKGDKNKELRVTADVKYEKATVAPTDIKITYSYKLGGEEKYTGVVASEKIAAGEWTTITGTFLVEGSHVDPFIYFESTDNNAELYIDNLVISETKPVPITGVSLDNKALSLKKNEVKKLTATIQPSNANTDKTLTWTSSNEAIAIVDQSGNVKAIAPGEANITVSTKINGESKVSYTDTCVVTVSNVEAMTINPPSATLTASGASIQLDTNKTDVTWTSSNPNVATVVNGLVTAVGEGTSVITATSADGSITCTVTVSIPPTDGLIFKADFEGGVDPFTNGYNPDQNPPEGPWHNGAKAIVTSEGNGFNGSNGYMSITAGAGEDYRGIGYSFTNTEPKTYRIVARVKNAAAETGKTVRLQKLPSYSDICQVEINNTEWTLIDQEFTLDAGQCVIIAPSWSNGGKSAYNYYVDDFMLYEVTDTNEPVVISDNTPTYGLTINGTPETGLSILGKTNVISVSGASITTSSYKVASVYLDESYIGKTVTITAKVRRDGASGNLAWQLTGTYATLDGRFPATADTWIDISGSQVVTQACELYLCTGDDYLLTTYYITDVVITVTEP